MGLVNVHYMFQNAEGYWNVLKCGLAGSKPGVEKMRFPRFIGDDGYGPVKFWYFTLILGAHILFNPSI